jgi:tetratricopeptide (TPR) repeat protein
MAMSQKFPEKSGEYLQKAMSDYNRGVEIVGEGNDNKAKGELFINRGAAHGAFNRFPEAILDMTKGLEFDPKNENGYANRSLAYFNMRNFQKAADDYSKYLEIDPLYAEMYYERGLCEMQLAKIDEAIADFTKAISMETDKKGKSFGLYHIERARARASKNLILEAQSDLQIAQSVGIPADADLLARLKK